jgi:hypothetical protein
LIIAFENSGGWSSKLAGTRLSDDIRYPEIADDRVYAVTTADEAIRILNEKINLYNDRHDGINKH